MHPKKVVATIPWYSVQDSCSRLQGFLFFFFGGGRVAQSRDANQWNLWMCRQKIWWTFCDHGIWQKNLGGGFDTDQNSRFFLFFCNRQWVSWPRTDGFFRGNGRRWIRRGMDVYHGLANFSGMIHQVFFFGEGKYLLWLLWFGNLGGSCTRFPMVPGSLPRCAATNPNCYEFQRVRWIWATQTVFTSRIKVDKLVSASNFGILTYFNMIQVAPSLPACHKFPRSMPPGGKSHDPAEV